MISRWLWLFINPIQLPDICPSARSVPPRAQHTCEALEALTSLLGGSILLSFGLPNIAFGVLGILQARGGEALHAADVAWRPRRYSTKTTVCNKLQDPG